MKQNQHITNNPRIIINTYGPQLGLDYAPATVVDIFDRDAKAGKRGAFGKRFVRRGSKLLGGLFGNEAKRARKAKLNPPTL